MFMADLGYYDNVSLGLNTTTSTISTITTNTLYDALLNASDKGWYCNGSSSGVDDRINLLQCQIDELTQRLYRNQDMVEELEKNNKELKKMVLNLTTLVLTKIGNEQLKN